MQSKSANFIIRIKSFLLLELVQRCVDRAYAHGVRDGQRGVDDSSRVRIDPDILRRFL